MKRLSVLTLVFSIAFVVFFFGPPFLSKLAFGPYPLMKVADVFDLLTPLVLIPLSWLMLRSVSDKPAPLPVMIGFFVFAALWVEGHGMHLAANSIGHLLDGMKGSDVYKLTAFYDERLSHYMWHSGIVGLSAVLMVRQRQEPFSDSGPRMWSALVAGVIYGFAFFAIVIEGGTGSLGIPFAVAAVLFISMLARRSLNRQPVNVLFLVGYGLALILFVAWAAYYGGLPQFSEVGIL